MKCNVVIRGLVGYVLVAHRLRVHRVEGANKTTLENYVRR